MNISEIMDKQRAYYKAGLTRSYEHRMSALNALENAVKDYEEDIKEALYEDFRKSPFESYMCEIGMLLDDIRYMKKHLASYMRDRRVKTPLAQFPAVSYISQEPYGVVLIMHRGTIRCCFHCSLWWEQSPQVTAQ